MRAKTVHSVRIASLAILSGIVLVLTGCEKPKLRSDASNETVESSATQPQADPFTPPTKSRSPQPAAATTAAPSPFTAPSATESKTTPSSPSTLDPAARAREYARLQKMLDAQLVGIQTIRSDLARHSAVLNQLRGQLQSVRALQAGAKSGGVRVERVGGESTLVNRAAEARELEAKIRAEEPLVAQFSKTLQEAQQQYAALQRSMEQLLVE